jgi:hypothetical protein
MLAGSPTLLKAVEGSVERTSTAVVPRRVDDTVSRVVTRHIGRVLCRVGVALRECRRRRPIRHTGHRLLDLALQGRRRKSGLGYGFEGQGFWKLATLQRQEGQGFLKLATPQRQRREPRSTHTHAVPAMERHQERGKERKGDGKGKGTREKNRVLYPVVMCSVIANGWHLVRKPCHNIRRDMGLRMNQVAEGYCCSGLRVKGFGAGSTYDPGGRGCCCCCCCCLVVPPPDLAPPPEPFT